MSTRSRIGILQHDGTVKSVYHHSDGYPSWLGKKLVQKYKNADDIHILMKDGDISCLESRYTWDMQELSTPIVRTYKMRGEDCPAMIHKNEAEFRKYAKQTWGEFAYLFKNNEWIGWSISRTTSRRIKIPA